MKDYLRHLDERFKQVMDMARNIKGKKEFMMFLKKIMEEKDEIEFTDENESKTEKFKDERKIFMNKNDFIIVCITGTVLVLIVWGISFLALFYYMKQQRTSYFNPRTVRFTKLNNESPKVTVRARPNPRPILKSNQPAYVVLDGIQETMV